MAVKSYGLTGFPLGHSMSPVIHGELMKLRGVDGSYGLIEIKQGNLKREFESRLKTLDGFNVTIPYKSDIIPMLDGLSEKAKLLGAVNTVKVENGRATGYNTDCTGFLRSLEFAGIKTGKTALICGCGGAGRMFAFECAAAGADVTLAVRESSFNKAETLKAEINEKTGAFVTIENIENVGGEYDIIINATPVGMYPKTDASPLEKDVISRAGAVFDAVYNPKETLFIKYAKECGVKCVNGLPMLVIQAAAAQEIWNGVKYGDDEIKKIITLTEKELERR